MAKNQDKTAIAKMVPNAIKAEVDGQEIVVATNAQENSILNMILASQLRAKLQVALRKWDEMDTVPTPKEIKDMAEAGAIIAKFSGEVYSKGDVVSEPKDEKNVTPAVEEVKFE